MILLLDTEEGGTEVGLPWKNSLEYYVMSHMHTNDNETLAR